MNNETYSNDQLRHSYSSSEKKIDLFNSEVEINAVDSLDEENNQSKKEYCTHCMNMFDFSIHYDVQNLELLLEAEILDFETQILMLNQRKNEIFKALYVQIKDVIDTSLRTPCEILTYGSFATGMNMPWSDIDILLDIPGEPDYNCLEILETAFSKTPLFVEVKFIKNTTVPVLKLSANSQFDSIKIDITLKDLKHSGLNCVALVQQFMIIYPPLKPIAIILKQLLYLGKLNDPYQKGLSSYGLILMIVAYFQWLIATDSYENICENLGRILLQLLKHYGSSFDYINWKIVPFINGEITNPYLPVD